MRDHFAEILTHTLLETITILPDRPGIYQYFDTSGKLLYVGKAKNLKKRVRSYFRFTPDLQPNPTLSMRIVRMLQEAVTLDYLIVESEEDALILENSLIKQLKPKYNILLRDDKTYPYIYIDEADTFPRFEITRKVLKQKSITYFGPFPNGAKALLDALYEIFPLVQRKSCPREKRACLFHQINRCLAPCEGKISKEEYARIVDQAKDAIMKRKFLIDRLEQKMVQYACEERFEEAAKVRDMREAIGSLTIASGVDLAQKTDLDIFAILSSEERGVAVKLFLRDGKIISSSYSYFRHTELFDENDAYKQILLEHYSPDYPLVPDAILVAHPFTEHQEIAALLSKRFGKKINLISPSRGSKAKLVLLALENAKELLGRQKSDDQTEDTISDLLRLSATPYRVETFDNSHMMGVATVGAMVVWNEGKWEKKSYRRYELHQKDEYGQMREMLQRRIESFGEEPAPDLWILDGGGAILALAKKLLQEAHIHLDVIAIAKEKLDAKAHRAKGAAKDLLYTDHGIIELKPNDKRLQWIQRQRDEAHRFAVTYHQNKKRREDTQISLLSKKGIGKATIKKLLDYFGTFEAIERSNLEDLAKIIGTKRAIALKDDIPKKQ